MPSTLRFCLPARGNEKLDAEEAVKAVQTRFATPEPRVADLGELNAIFRRCCQAERDRVVQSRSGPFLIEDRLVENLASASPLPKHWFDPCVICPAVPVDKFQTIAFDGCRYSVPRRFAFEAVSIKGYVAQIGIVAHGQVVATHPRSREKPAMILDPIHYLAKLGRKPGALDHAPVFRDWKLPACFPEMRAELEQLHGALGGSRRFVRVLQLLGDHPMTCVRQALGACLREHLPSAEAVIQRTRSRAALDILRRDATAHARDEDAAPRVDVPRPDLSRFDQLLSGPGTGGPVSVFFA